MKRPRSLHNLVLSPREIQWQRYALSLELGQELLQRQLVDARAEALLWRLQLEEILNQAKGDSESM